MSINSLKGSMELYTNKELVAELARREHTPPALPKLSPAPYQIMLDMIKPDWREDSRKGYYNPLISQMWEYLGYPAFTDDQSWCAATVNFCLKVTGYPTSEVIPLARSFESYGSKNYSDPNVGDIVVFKRVGSDWQGHVGFFKHIDRDYNRIVVAGGNQNNEVCFKDYPIKSDSIEYVCTRNLPDRINEPDFDTINSLGLS